MAIRADGQRGQSIFEYFILSIIVVSVALFFLKTNNYKQIYNASESVFNNAVSNITE